MTDRARALGACYYPEHWPAAQWAEDAARMKEIGLTYVRIVEFAQARIKAEPGSPDWAWLNESIEVLSKAGLKVVLGTPTATPPRLVLNRHPDMIALDAQGRPRGFGLRRHYCFSHEGCRKECARIVTLMAERYGRNPHVAAWQTDNEYGCHDTILGYSTAARDAFRNWLARKYRSPQALNRAWGNVFWSMDHAGFEDIELPNLTVTEPNPAHVIGFHLFSSDQVVTFTDIPQVALRLT